MSAVPVDPADGAGVLRDHLDRFLANHGAGLVRLRRHIHAHPDLSGAEEPTAALIADRLRDAGLQPQLLPRGDGVTCDVGPADAGPPTIALRADIDALPIQDAKDVPYRSTVDGVCHACGHDVHTAIVLGAGLALAALGDRLTKPVRLIFQPAEESFPSGAREVIDVGRTDGLRQIFALHCDPRIPCGQIGLRVGPLTAAADRLKITVSGPGGHTARPHLTVDLVNAIARIAADVPALLARRVDARAGLSLVFGSVHSGVAPNAIPQQGFVAGTVRCLDHAAWELAPKLIEQLVHQVAAPTGATAEVEYTRGVPPVVNDAQAVAVFASASTAALGPQAIVDTPQSMGGEDFSWYLERIRGAMARLGVGRPGEDLDLHQGTFDVDEGAIAVGVRVLVHTAVTAGAELTPPA